MTSAVSKKQIVRLLKILAKNPSCSGRLDKQDNCLVLTSTHGQIRLPLAVLTSAKSDGLIVQTGECLKITNAGRAFLKRQLCDHDPYANQHRILQNRVIKTGHKKQIVTENYAESPLARLYSRKQKDGARFITCYELESGERIRRDFERAGLQPSITASWESNTTSASKSGWANNVQELSEMAIDAKKRFEKAMNAVGPELTDVTIDVCCFLKGFEVVEREHGWPKRSAKLLLKTALSKLARHYGYAPSLTYRSGNNSATIGSWGTPDYRPVL